MKKLFTLIAAALMAVGASAEEGKISLNLSEALRGWGEISVDEVTGEVTVGDNGAYGWWVTKPGDVSYTKLVFEMQNVQKSSWFQLSLSDADNFPFDDGSYIKVIDVSSVEVSRVMFQGGKGTKYTIKEAYFATDAYIAANNVKDEKIYGDTQELSLASLGSGWNAEYSADTKTITITGEDGGGKGWWVKPADYSHFDNFVVEFDPATTVGGQVVVQYVEDPDKVDAVAFNKGATCVVVPLDATKKGAVQQMYIQGAKDATFTLKSAFVAIASATPEANLGTIESGETSLAINYAEMKAGDFTVENAQINATESKDTKTVYDIEANQELKFWLNTAPSVVFTITNGDAKKKIFNVNFNDNTTTDKGSVEFGGKNGVVIINDAKVGDEIKMTVAAKGSTAGKIGVLPSSGNELITSTELALPKKDKEAVGADAEGYVWKEFSFKVTEDMIKTLEGVKVVRIKETGGGYRCKALSINAPLPTGIESVKAAKSAENNGAIYNLAGQKVNESYKGIVIKNGKKYIQK